MVFLAETTVSELTDIIDRFPWFAGNGKKVDSSVMLYSSILKVSVSRQDGRYILKYSRAMLGSTSWEFHCNKECIINDSTSHDFSFKAASASFDEDMMNSFQDIQIDDDWVELHRKILGTRETSNLTITEFLVCVGLNPNRAYFKHLCTKTITKLHPSKRRNSPGREFRDAVSKYFVNLAANSTRTLSHGSPQTLETVVSDWYLDNRTELRGLGISDIYLSKSNPFGIIIEAYQNCAVSDAEILQMLMKDSKILETVEGMHASSLIVESRSLSQLLGLVSSPACVKLAMVGTATTEVSLLL